MSYTYKVKNEIIKKSSYTTKEKVAELRGILEVKNAILEDRIELKLESIELANRVYRILKEVTTLNIRVKYLVSKHFGEHKVYVIIIENQHGFKDLLRILATCKEDQLLKDEEKRVGFIRGLFLMSGYIKSPEKEYALDFFIDNIEIGEELFRIFENLHKKVFITDKRKKKLVYFRNSEDILDVLVMLGAIKEFYKYEETTMMKDLKNKTIREMNWEVANETKSLNTGLKQTRMINYIGKKIGLNELTPVLEEIAFLRLKNPESSLQELAEMIGISKSGIRNRFRRIEAIYKELLKEN
ncbi:DNA-binding protein WhiA [Fusobacterium sp. IOR10]|uniref:DNA-binding protein WhiA n=1 Tax=Fusobacterium sp. IOR10 TaxID=2665157 RepID=UPI0013D59B1A|nr:DNA-binding protein WhiA [Fusobacterium sp. IOR10]